MLWAPRFVKRHPAAWAVVLFLLVVLPGALDAWLSLWERWRQGTGKETPTIPLEVPDWLSLSSSILGLLMVAYIIFIQRAEARKPKVATSSAAETTQADKSAVAHQAIKSSTSKAAADGEIAKGKLARAGKAAEESRRRSIEKFRKLLPHFPVDQKGILLALLKGPRPFRRHSSGVSPLERKGYITAEHLHNEKDHTYIYELVDGYREAAKEWRDAECRGKVKNIASRLSESHKLALSYFTLPTDSDLRWPEANSDEMKLLYGAFRALSREGLLRHVAPYTSNRQSFTLEAELWPFVSELILDGKTITRGTVTIS